MPYTGAIASVPKGFVKFEASADMHVTVRVGDKAAVLSGGYGGWAEINRPRDDALIEWLGHSAMQLSIPIIFDGLRNMNTPWGASIEHDIRLLEHLTHINPGYNSPPRIWALGQVIPFPDREWVINDIKWTGDDIRRPEDGERVRASADIVLFEYIEYDIINGRLSSAARRKHAKANNQVRTKQKKGKYTVKEGDTLRKIAKRELGSANKWHEIARVNHIRDGKALRRGQKLKMP